MNPVTQALLKHIDDVPLHAFAADWDALEALVIEVYKEGGAGADQESEYRQLRARLSAAYQHFAEELAPHWRATRIKGQHLQGDPFASLIAPEEVTNFVENWPALQTLPAAREAFNEMLVARLDRGQP